VAHGYLLNEKTVKSRSTKFRFETIIRCFCFNYFIC